VTMTANTGFGENWDGVLAILASNEFRGRRAKIDRRPLIEAANSLGHCPMRVLHWQKLVDLGRIPRSDEGHAVDAIQGITAFRTPIVELFMVSHRWLRPSLDAAQSHPDNEYAHKASALNEFSLWRRKWVHVNHGFWPEIFYWIDYSCIDQENAAAAVPLLPLWVACCERFLRIETADYDDRAWCRVEPLLAYAFSFADHHVSIELDFCHRWPHFGKATERPILDPLEGKLTNADDMTLISPLVEIATHFHSVNNNGAEFCLNKTAITCYRL
jgi:hypothetical protein